MFQRKRALRDPVTLTLDGAEVTAERGEPIAAALLAADKTILARSPKLHRPRSPSCFRGACDGCLARVDGVPNVMTCQRPAQGGERVESQNVIGSRKADLLRVTDWFFRDGLDHHHMFAGVPGLSDVMQTVATKVAGLGRLPSQEEPAHEATREEVDVLVVGGGLSGMVVASRVASAGASVRLVDDGIALGGALAALPARRDALVKKYPLASERALVETVVGGVYEGRALVAGRDGARLVRSRALVFATGAHDGMVAFAGNDLPGVFPARALLRLLALGLEIDGPTVIAGSGFWSDELSRALPNAARVALTELQGVEGAAGVKRVITGAKGGATKSLKASVLALDAPGAPAFEVAVQAGARVRVDVARGYVVDVESRGRAGERVWATGECTGLAFDPAALEERALDVANDVLASLR